MELLQRILLALPILLCFLTSTTFGESTTFHIEAESLLNVEPLTPFFLIIWILPLFLGRFQSQMTFHKNSCMYVPTRSLTTENSNFSRSSDPDIFSNLEGWEGFCLNVNDNCNNCNHYHYLCAFASADFKLRCWPGWFSAYTQDSATAAARPAAAINPPTY